MHWPPTTGVRLHEGSVHKLETCHVSIHQDAAMVSLSQLRLMGTLVYLVVGMSLM